VIRRMLAGVVLMSLAAPAVLAETCPPPPEPVLSLSFGSRYAEGDESRSEIDPEAAEEAGDAIRPVDDFLRDLADTANEVFEEDADQTAIADCVLSQIGVWARADALSDLSSETAGLTAGSRIAGFSLVLMQVLPFARNADDVAVVKDWMRRMMQAQTAFWETEAPDRARQGNLRAWAALAGASTAAILDDTALRAWSAWSVANVLCSADPDGSLPQEMRRGRFALHYQFHAIAPLVVSTALLKEQGIDLRATCDDALSRVVAFAMNDIDDGAATTAITGKTQSFFDGTDEFEGFLFAWIEAYLALGDIPNGDALNRFADQYRPLRYSKLGGNQTLFWQNRP
jgi:poly(beta-D-mannuronate) lyase